jgi:polyhydroxyalkanoate synthesis regulator phasin
MAKTITIRCSKAIAERAGYLLASQTVGTDKEGVPQIYDRAFVHTRNPLADNTKASPATMAEDAIELKRRIHQLEQEIASLKFDQQQVRQAALAESNAEMGQLRKTIQALRDEMDAVHFDKAQAVQAAVAAAQAEIHQLHETVQKLRQVLDDTHYEKQQAVQQIVTASRGEIDQLKATVQALRDQLDQKQQATAAKT